MVNPSIEGLVKIGKTTHEPEIRAKELSQATGVASPFYPAFSIRVSDCHAAEEYVHAILDHKGFRHTKNREFFQIPLRDAIEALMLVEKQFPIADDKLTASKAEEIKSNEHPGGAIFEQAVRIYYGKGDEIKDRDEATQLLQRAAALNFPAAYTSLAQHFRNEAFAVRISKVNWDRKAYALAREAEFRILKEGAQIGIGRCWVQMAEWYLRGDKGTERAPDLVSAEKCWKKYFQSEAFIKDNDDQWEDQNWAIEFFVGDPLDNIAELGFPRIVYVYSYLKNVAKQELPINSELMKILTPLKDEIITVNNSTDNGGDDQAAIRDLVQRML